MAGAQLSNGCQAECQQHFTDVAELTTRRRGWLISTALGAMTVRILRLPLCYNSHDTERSTIATNLECRLLLKPTSHGVAHSMFGAEIAKPFRHCAEI